jgi:hypothetical protein
MYKPQTQNQARRALRTTQSQFIDDPSGKDEEAGLLRAFKNLLRPFKNEPRQAENRPRRASAINRDRLMRRMQIVASETDNIECEDDYVQTPVRRESFDEGTIDDGTLRPFLTEDDFVQKENSSYDGLIDRLCAEVKKKQELEKASSKVAAVSKKFCAEETFAPPPMSSSRGIPCVPLYGVKQKSLPPISQVVVKSSRRSDFGVGLPPVAHC